MGKCIHFSILTILTFCLLSYSATCQDKGHYIIAGDTTDLIHGTLPDLYNQEIDLNLDSISDFESGFYSYDGPYPNDHYLHEELVDIYIQNLRSNQIRLICNTTIPDTILVGDTIDSRGCWVTISLTKCHFYYYDYVTPNGGWLKDSTVWLVQDKYVGLRLISKLDTAYGWVRCDSLFITEFACQKGFNIGIDQVKAGDFVLYPNPTNDFVYIQFSGMESRQIRIFNIYGHLLYEVSTRDKNPMLSLESFPAGLYFVVIQSAKTKLLKRIIKA
jgi:hypothetical protein